MYIADWNVLWASDVVTTEKAERRSTREQKSETASLDVRRLGLSQPMVQSHPAARQRKHTAAMNANMWSNTHDTSASAEVVVGSKIWLYWSRNGPAWLVDAPLELLPAFGRPGFLRAGVTIWVAW
jgi:hypothetical protein